MQVYMYLIIYITKRTTTLNFYRDHEVQNSVIVSKYTV